jgi:hypothetical protein
MLHSIVAVQEKIAEGKLPLFLAGSESALSQLPKGNWIGGSIPYFMDVNGGVCSESQVFVSEAPACALSAEIREYDTRSLPSICRDAPENGLSFLIMPAGSPVHLAYAQDAPGYDGLYLKPVIGWISGVHVSQIGKQQPKVFNGRTGGASSESAVVMHVALPPDKLVELDIVNVFQPGSGETIEFPNSGFSATECLIDGQSTNFAQYLSRVQPDRRVPLTASYNGTIVNVSLQSVDEAAGVVNFYAPVFPDVKYKFAEPVADYVDAFKRIVDENAASPTFSCNCILNYLYANLEGKRTGAIIGPITFGEIAHQLLNQTLVRLFVRDIA